VAVVKPVVEPVAKPVAPVVAAAPVVSPKERPKLERILQCVEVHTQLSRFILTGRGSDSEIDNARSLFVTIARGFGYPEEPVALALRKNPDQAKSWNVPKPWTKKFTESVDSIKGKL
jgi:hypothetical protein